MKISKSTSSIVGWARNTLLTGLVFASASLVQAQDQANPYVQITAGQDSYQVPLTPDGKLFGFSEVFETADYKIEINGTLNTDPSIAYGIAVADFGAPSVFGFAFFTPIVPTGPGTIVDASVVGGLTDFTGDGVSLTPTGPTLQLSDVYFPMTSMGVGVGAAAVHPPGAPGSFYTYGPFAAGPTPGPAGVWTGLGVTTGFTLSGGGDIAALTGFAEVVTASVPDAGATLGLFGLALSGLAFFRRKS